MTLLSTQLVNFITEVGFPVGAFYLMWDLVRNTIRENTQAFNELKIVVETLLSK